ncbi:MAG: MATE family efflux transporter, partial [Ruminococcus sp.]|nr:MATE family efflux transporter [Ruminococcus sp.]
MTQTYNLTEGKVHKILLQFFFPMFFTNLLQQIYSFADTTIVGKGIGDNALASIGNMSPLIFLITGFSMGLTNGFSILIAQSYGSKNYSELRKTIALSIKISIIISLLLTV